MATLNNPNVFIQVRIARDTKVGRFRDAMYFSVAEYQALTNQQVLDLAAERAQAWVSAVEEANQRPRSRATREWLLQFKEEIERQLAES